MAKVDQEAAQKELDTAARLNKKADDLIDAADELRREAEHRERDAEQLTAPVKPSPSGSSR
jgi:hypothetical protein